MKCYFVLPSMNKHNNFCCKLDTPMNHTCISNIPRDHEDVITRHHRFGLQPHRISHWPKNNNQFTCIFSLHWHPFHQARQDQLFLLYLKWSFEMNKRIFSSPPLCPWAKELDSSVDKNQNGFSVQEIAGHHILFLSWDYKCIPYSLYLAPPPL